MNINRHNYEEYFLLYVDNELSIVQRKAVESFIAGNPDLKAELEILKESILPADDSIVFSNKEALLRTASAPNPVNDTNCEEYFVLYADDELTNGDKDLVEQFVYRNPQHQAAFELMQQVKLMPDTAIVFPNKYALYRQEEDDRVVPVIRMRWWRIAAAAAVLLFVGGMGWYMSTNGKSENVTPANPSIAFNDSNKTKQSATRPAKEEVANNNTQKDQQKTTGVAVINDQQKKAAQHPVVTAPAKTDKSLDIANNEKKKEKNTVAPSNIPANTNVPPIEEAPQEKPDNTLATAVPKKVETTPIATKIDIPVKSNTDLAYNQPVVEPIGDSDPELASTNDKKNKMRGFFRKVSRVFEKTANIDADGKERSGIRIASFEIALK